MVSPIGDIRDILPCHRFLQDTRIPKYSTSSSGGDTNTAVYNISRLLSNSQLFICPFLSHEGASRGVYVLPCDSVGFRCCFSSPGNEWYLWAGPNHRALTQAFLRVHDCMRQLLQCSRCSARVSAHGAPGSGSGGGGGRGSAEVEVVAGPPTVTIDRHNRSTHRRGTRAV